MKSVYISSSETRIEPYQRRMFLFVQSVNSCLLRSHKEVYELSHLYMPIKRRISHARVCGLVSSQLASFLRHHRHRCCHSDGITVRGGDLDREFQLPGANTAFAAFSTPNVAHFSAALLVAAMLSAPWQVLWNISLLLGLCGLGGVVYVIIVGRRVRRQTSYEPVLEDWLWHTAFPLVSYTGFIVAALLLPIFPAPALFVIGAAAVLLLFVGVHNAWDGVTYLVLERVPLENKSQD